MVWLCWLPVLGLAPACGQSNEPRVAGGVFASTGFEDVLGFSVSAGGYMEASRFRFRPGVELRGSAGDVEGKLMMVGPRVSLRVPGHDAYAGALFGPSHILNTKGPGDISGVTSEFVIGVEKDIGPYVRWRQFELGVEYFSGTSSFKAMTISTGFVFHIH